MQVRRTAFNFAAIAVVVVSMVAANAPAKDTGVDALNVTEVASVPFPRGTHLEFLTRVIGGVTHTLALSNSRDTSALPGWTAPAGGLNIIDINDPEHPQFLTNVPCKTNNVDVASIQKDFTIRVIDRADGVARSIQYDTILALASNSTTGCISVKGPDGQVINVPDSSPPKALKGGSVSFVGLRKTPLPGDVITADWLGSPVVNPSGTRFLWTNIAHTVQAHPTKPVFYADNQSIGDRNPTLEVIRLDSWPPVVTAVPLASSGSGPHDITFRADGNRAYASSINASFIWDTSGNHVYAPVLISTLVAPGLKIHHEANLHPDGRHLLVVDEFVATSSGGAVTATPNCPGGGVHVFDLGDGGALEAAPVQVGTFFANDTSVVSAHKLDAGDPAGSAPKMVEVGCTAHEFTMSPDGAWMPIAWFGAGLRIFDLRSLQRADTLAAPSPVAVTEVGHFKTPDINLWAAKVRPEFPGYIFVSDEFVGFKVYKFDTSVLS